jgi:hypothetical protein
MKKANDFNGRLFINEESCYLLQAKEQAAAEKQLAIQVPSVPSAGKATQLRAAPILK